MIFDVFRRFCARFGWVRPVPALASEEDCIQFGWQCVTRDDVSASLDFSATDEGFDWSPIARMTWLETLVINGYSMNLPPPLDLALLAEFDKLTYLAVNRVPLANVQELASVPLKELSLGSTEIKEFAFLESLSELRRLSLKKIKGLERIDQIPGATLSKLTGLALSGEALTDLHVLSQARALEELRLKSGAENLSGVGALPALEILEVRGHNMRSLDGFEPGLRLDFVSLFGWGLEDISVLAHAPNLEVLSAANTSISDISALSNARNLKTLSVSDQVEDLSPLAGNISIEKLRVGIPTSDLTPLAECRALQNLNISYTQVTDLSPLAGLENLTRLNIAGTKITDLTPLLPLADQLYLEIDGDKILSGQELFHFIKGNGHGAQ